MKVDSSYASHGAIKSFGLMSMQMPRQTRPRGNGRSTYENPSPEGYNDADQSSSAISTTPSGDAQVRRRTFPSPVLVRLVQERLPVLMHDFSTWRNDQSAVPPPLAFLLRPFGIATCDVAAQTLRCRPTEQRRGADPGWLEVGCNGGRVREDIAGESHLWQDDEIHRARLKTEASRPPEGLAWATRRSQQRSALLEQGLDGADVLLDPAELVGGGAGDESRVSLVGPE